MKNLNEKIDLKKIKEYLVVILFITITISIFIVVNDMHQQSILDREFGKLLIKEKCLQLEPMEDGCGH